MAQEHTHERELREQWKHIQDTLEGTWVMLVHADSGITWGSFYVESYELSSNGQFELILHTSNLHSPLIKINAGNPWYPQAQP